MLFYGEYVIMNMTRYSLYIGRLSFLSDLKKERKTYSLYPSEQKMKCLEEQRKNRHKRTAVNSNETLSVSLSSAISEGMRVGHKAYGRAEKT